MGFSDPGRSFHGVMGRDDGLAQTVADPFGECCDSIDGARDLGPGAGDLCQRVSDAFQEVGEAFQKAGDPCQRVRCMNV